MGTETDEIKKPAPTLYAIIGIKLLKGLLFVTVALVAYTLSDNDLPEELRKLLHHLRLNPERKFWADLATRVGEAMAAQQTENGGWDNTGGYVSEPIRTEVTCEFTVLLDEMIAGIGGVPS